MASWFKTFFHTILIICFGLIMYCLYYMLFIVAGCVLFYYLNMNVLIGAGIGFICSLFLEITFDSIKEIKRYFKKRQIKDGKN